MQKPCWEHKTPGWDAKTSDIYKINYFLKHCIRLVEAIERQEELIKEANNEHWARAHHLVSMPQAIVPPDIDINSDIN